MTGGLLFPCAEGSSPFFFSAPANFSPPPCPAY
jgi:hypothetical protein